MPALRLRPGALLPSRDAVLTVLARRRFSEGVPVNSRHAHQAARPRPQPVDLGPRPSARTRKPGADQRSRLRTKTRPRRRQHPAGRARFPVEPWTELADGRRLGHQFFQGHLPWRPEREPGFELVRKPRRRLVERQVRADDRRCRCRISARNDHVEARVMRRPGAAVVFSILAIAGVQLGIWWAPFAFGFAFGVSSPRARIALPVGAGIGLVGWLFPLATVEAQHGLGPTAESLAAILGAGHQAAIPAISRKSASVSADGATPSSR